MGRIASSLALIAGLGLLAMSAPASAQDADLDALKERYLAHEQAGRYVDAETTAAEAADLCRSRFGPDGIACAEALERLASVQTELGKYLEAEANNRRALALREAHLGKDHLDVAQSLNKLAIVLQEQGKSREADAFYLRALAIREAQLGVDHPDVANTVNNLGSLNEERGHYDVAEAYYQRALAVFEAKLARDDTRTAVVLNNLALVLQLQGKDQEAEALYRRSLAMREAKLGTEHIDVAATVGNLGSLYLNRGDHAVAQAYFKRALTIYEARLGADHRHTADVLGKLASTYAEQGKFAEAEAGYRRALAINEAALGERHSSIAVILNDLSVLLFKQRKYVEAEAELNRALAITGTALGEEHPHVAETHINLATALGGQKRYAEMEASLRRALEIGEARLGGQNPAVARTLLNLSIAQQLQGKHAEALGAIRKASAIVRHRQGDPVAGTRSHAGNPVEASADYLSRHIALLHEAAQRGIETRRALGHEGFEIAQRAAHSAAAVALAQMSARQARTGGALAQLVRERQDVGGQRRVLDRRLIDAVAGSDVSRTNSLRDQIGVLDARFAALDARLAREFPDFAALALSDALPVAAAQALLRDDEALLLVTDAEDASFAWLVTRTESRWIRLAARAKQIAERVQALRCGLDMLGEWLHHDARNQRCTKLLRLEATPRTVDWAPFDLHVAHDLHELLFASFKDLLVGKHLLVVPSDSLSGLPFQVLVTARAAARFPANGNYAGVSFLGTQHSLSVLPSVSSLKALREQAGTSSAALPYLGVGNPLLLGAAGNDQRSSRRQNCEHNADGTMRVAARRIDASETRNLVRGGRADVALLRELDPLPETADELCDVGRSFAAAPGDILLGSRATERSIKALSASGGLASYRVLHFATHGLLPRETARLAGGLDEAALLLTPPLAGSDEDDGLLTASEVTLLKLDAELVIMSACNTGGGDRSGEALSGLARAFFYAGARALLVSHWYVETTSAVALTTRMFDEMRQDPRLGRAEALRRAMGSLIANGGPHAHPTYWAPFSLVGEGRAR